MLVMRLQGGLGNQLFQYSAGRAISESLGVPLWLDLSWYRSLPKGAIPRAYELQRYPINARCFDPLDPESPWFWSIERLGCLAWVDGRLRWARSFRERGLDHDPVVAKLRPGRVLEGYWQSPRYFDVIAPALREELQPLASLGEEDAHIAGMIQQDAGNAVAVHVRRGDYLTGVHALHHGTCGIDYYQRAFEKIRVVIERPRFFVFSDDPDWVRSRKDVFGEATLVEHNNTKTAFQDLRLMSLCRGHVIANSSFSWWGAWLSRSPGKLVIAPARWLGNGAPLPTLMPPDWVRL